MPLPHGPEQLSRAWLSSILGERVESVSAERIVTLGGVNGEAFRLSLQGAHVPRTLIAKFPAPGAGARGVASYQRWYEREVRFYREFAPASPLRVPRCWLAEIDASDAYVLLLEDLVAPGSGRRQGDQIAGCTVEEARAAVEQIAALHARWWDGVHQYDWLPRTTVGLDRARPVGGAFARAWQRARERPDIPPSIHGGLDAAVEAYPALLEAISSPPVTLVHGDYRLDNVFFEATDRGVEVAAIDWQFACKARGMYDVAYFIGLDLDPRMRRTHEHALIETYLGALRAAGVEDYDDETAWRDYRIALILGLAVFVIGAGGEMPDERTRAMHDVGIARLAAAIEEARALDVLGTP